jgi:hypothetical protein
LNVAISSAATARLRFNTLNPIFILIYPCVDLTKTDRMNR